MNKLKLFLLTFLLSSTLATSPAQAAWSEQFGRYSNTLNWQMSPQQQEQVKSFTLKLDGQVFLTNIANQNQITTNYILRRNSTGDYSLNLIAKLKPGTQVADRKSVV